MLFTSSILTYITLHKMKTVFLASVQSPWGRQLDQHNKWKIKCQFNEKTGQVFFRKQTRHKHFKHFWLHFWLHDLVHMPVRQWITGSTTFVSSREWEKKQSEPSSSLHLYNWSFRSSVWKFRNIFGMRNRNGKAIDSLSLSSWVRLFRPDWLGNIWNKQGETSNR